MGAKGNIANNGCGVIAAYNVLLSFSSRINFGKVYKELFSRGGPFIGGLLGTKPAVLTTYMKKYFWNVMTASSWTYLWGIKAELSEAIIVLIIAKDWSWGHYIAGINTGNGGVGGSFRFYNIGLGGIGSKTMSIWTLLKYIEKNNANPVYFIGVSGKKGWW